ncbi:hypothetical protein Hanom_Chr12g01070561 [Helianthus anomalus]
MDMKLTSRMKMARCKPFGSRCEKTNLWTKVAKLAKPKEQKWHFTLIILNKKNNLVYANVVDLDRRVFHADGYNIIVLWMKR